MARLAVELTLVLVSFAIYAAYHLWFFFANGRSPRTADATSMGKNLFNNGKIARAQFCEMVCESTDTIAGIQQNRNCLTAVSFLAGTAAILAQNMLSILLDEEKLQQIRNYGDDDPLTKGLKIEPALILGVNFVILMASIMSFSQAVRMYVHAGYFFKAGAVPHQTWITIADVAEVTVRGQVAQTLGMRLLFAFPISALWLLGPTAMAVTSVITTAIVAYLDHHSAPDASLVKMLERVADKQRKNSA